MTEPQLRARQANSRPWSRMLSRLVWRMFAGPRQGWERFCAHWRGPAQTAAEDAPTGQTRFAIDREAGSLAHELVQPLTAIASNAEAARHCLQQQPLDVRALQQIIDEIYVETRRALDIAEWIRGELRGDEPALHLVDLTSIIDGVVPFITKMAARYDAQLSVQLHGQPLHIRGSRVQIQQILVNLLMNAVEAAAQMPGGRRQVCLEAWQDGDTIRAAVRDSGRGAAEDRLKHIFDPFGSAKPNGLGLGLCLSRSIARRHGGDLVARNNVGPGMTFCLILPSATGTPADTPTEVDTPGVGRHARLPRSGQSAGGA